MKSLKKYTVDALLVQNPIDLRYLVGIDLSLGILLVTETESILFVDGRYKEKCKGLSITVDTLNQKSIQKHLRRLKIKKLGFDSSFVTVSSFQTMKEHFHAQELIACDAPLQELRAVKKAKELKALKKAADLCVKGFEYIVESIQEGISEKGLKALLEIFWLSNGGDRLSFDPIIAFGKASSMPHYTVSDTRLEKNQSVLVDLGVVVDGYASDMTRMIFFGSVSKKMREITDIVRRAEEKAIASIKPSVTSSYVYDKAMHVIDKAGYKKAFLHSLGHGIGLEVHEPPYLRAFDEKTSVVLKKGHVVTVEPGIYLPGVGGARIEDMVVVTKDGHKVLTDCPKIVQL